MIKIFDNSVISSMGKEIRSVKVLPVVRSLYDVRVTMGVIAECVNSKNEELIESINGISCAIEEDSLFKKTVDIIRRTDLRLGLGEASTMAASIILTHLGIKNYAVIDDGYARKTFGKVMRNRKLSDMFGGSLSNVNFTGTVGLINRLKTKDALTSGQCSSIANDLENSDFRVTGKILDLLR